ncbi:MAG: aminodeoxychorismate synthase component I [Candidatus Omnitrophota bacterium]|jgi:para-aminobenzoate synthetase/4-amino-4-deoxychorismate lyase
METVNPFKSKISSLLASCQNKPFVFLETAIFDKENTASFLFKDFTKIITFNHNDNVDLFFNQAESCLKKKLWLCGFFSYEFGYFLEPALYCFREKNNLPLGWLAACKNPIRINHKIDLKSLKESPDFKIKNLKANISFPEYRKAIAKIKSYLRNGTNYQTNFTFKLKFDFFGEALDFYLSLRVAQPTAYAALINTGKEFIISFSPELFFKKTGNKILTRPMKGSFKRGLTQEEDRKNIETLASDIKNQAENLMIVDLLRNDLGRVAKKVWVPELFNIEKYRTIHQMTSTVSADLKDNAIMKDIFTALFPSGSVTGAPKIKTIGIIKELEKEARGIYTGAIGYISPKKEACFNVAIRTIHLKNKKGEMGIGGGIVYDSSSANEYEEAFLKADFLTKKFPEFFLIETILFEPPEGYVLLKEHLARLEKSCEYFSIAADFKKLEKDLTVLAEKELTKKFKIRLLVDLTGNVKIEKNYLNKEERLVRVAISSKRINPDNIFLYHKTTERKIYDDERQQALKKGFFDVVFLNKKGEVTEGSISNVFIRKGGILYTPPVKCGLLNGVLRQHLFEGGKVKEKTLYLRDVLEADEVYIGNSVRGLLKVQVG